jgi:predicted NAD/FAD-binding protein
MKIAVIGGGASGIAAAYLLDEVHEVHLFERHPILGGNVRTLGGNVECPALEAGVVTENGVSWFHTSTFPNTHKLLEELDVPRTSTVLNTSIILENGHHCHMSALDCFRHFNWETLWAEKANLGIAARELHKLLLHSQPFSRCDLSAMPLKIFLDGLDYLVAQWIRGTVAAMLSTPFGQLDQMPSDLVIPLMQDWLRDRHCTILPDGIYSYMQAMLQRMRSTVHTGIEVESVRRTNDGVEIKFPDDVEHFDRVIIATTPECAWRLLADPTPDETRLLSPWRDCGSRTVAHCADNFYEPRGINYRTHCDFFDRTAEGVVGYNCCLNDLYDIRSDLRYCFSAGLKDWIDRDAILDEQYHVTPLYVLDSTQSRPELRALNGRNNTCYAGAWLIDGLHEGAITSAMEVAEILGGRKL